MVKTKSKKTLSQEEAAKFFASACDRAGLDSRQQFIMRHRLGVDGVRYPLGAIGVALQDGNVSRERVRQIEADCIRKLGGDWEILRDTFTPVVAPQAAKRLQSHYRATVKAYLRTLPKEDSIQYAEILQRLNIPIPANRTLDAAEMDQMETCWALLEDFGVRMFGRFRFCVGDCEQKIRPVEDFYPIRNKPGSYYQYCRECNTRRCGGYVDRNRAKVMERRKAWLDNKNNEVSA